GLGYPAADDAHALPRVLTQVAYADVENGSADQVDGLEAGAVEARRQFGHHRCRHARGPQALVRIAQGHVYELDGFLRHQCAAIWNFSSTQRVWICARANSGRCTRSAWNGTVVARPATLKRASADLAVSMQAARSGPLTISLASIES